MPGDINVLPNFTLDINELIRQADNSIIGSVACTLKDAWDYVFMGVHYSTEEKRILYEENLKSMSNNISKGIQNIPKENLQEPKGSVLGPALEASKYYIDEPEIRSMFENLIIHSANSYYNNEVRTSFTEIIKQLDPIDAKVLNSLNIYGEPIVNYIRQNKENSSYSTLYSNVLQNWSSDINDLKLIESTINNLKRLGLIEIPNGISIANKEVYSWSKSNIIFEKLNEDLKNSSYSETDIIEVQQNKLEISQFGKDFLNICAEPKIYARII